MKYVLQYTRHAREDLEQLDRTAAQRIILKLDFFCAQPKPLVFSTPLRGPLHGLYRFRIGNYRAIFHKDAKGIVTVLTVLRIKHRREVYE